MVSYIFPYICCLHLFQVRIKMTQQFGLKSSTKGPLVVTDKTDIVGQFPSPEPSTPNPEPRALNPEPRTPNPQPRTPNPEPSTPNPEGVVVNLGGSDVQPLSGTTDPNPYPPNT